MRACAGVLYFAFRVFLLIKEFDLTVGALQNRQDGSLQNLTIVLNSTLNGDPLDHYPVTVILTSSSDVMQVMFFAPYLGDDSVQRLHVFIANSDKHITQLEFDKETGAHSKTKLKTRLYWAPYNLLRVVENLEVKSQVVRETWSGSAVLPIKFLPPRPSLINVAVEHRIKDDHHWDSFYTITNYGIAIPDLMVLPRYRKIKPSILSNETSYSPEWKSDSK